MISNTNKPKHHLFQDLTGNHYARLVVVDFAYMLNSQSYWTCECDCGEVKVIRSSRLKAGTSKSCGCFASEMRRRPKKHGCARDGGETPEYRAWHSMINRTTNPLVDTYHLYGGRGISVCIRWRTSFASFLEDMGPRPSSAHSLDRWPDKDGNYEPGNCRWATLQEQGRNKRNNVTREYAGRVFTLVEMAEQSGINYQTLRSRLKSGWDTERALNTDPSVYHLGG